MGEMEEKKKLEAVKNECVDSGRRPLIPFRFSDCPVIYLYIPITVTELTSDPWGGEETLLVFEPFQCSFMVHFPVQG